MDKKKSRVRRAKRTRAHIKRLGVNRLCVYRTPRHIYAQIISESGSEVLSSASTLEKVIKDALKTTGNIDAAKAIGKLIAERAKEKGINQVAFDRSGFRYHGRVQALADSARENGLEF